MQSVLKGFSSFIPGLDLNAPAKSLSDLIASTHSLDTEITNVEALATQASTFVSDTSFLLGGDFTETRTSLQNFITYIQEYEKKVAGWRDQDKDLLEKVPAMDKSGFNHSDNLPALVRSFTVRLAPTWTHIQRGADPFDVLRQKRVIVVEEIEEIVYPDQD